MIAMGGAIGVGLFLGAGKRLHDVGPGLVLSYLACGIAAFFVMRALGELVLYKPVSGSFVEYAREFIGPWAGFTAGWFYWLNWAFTGIAEITAAGTYMKMWLPGVPEWLTALIALVCLLAANLLSVKLFGELEFWFSTLKVAAIFIFLVVGVTLVLGGLDVGGQAASVHNLTDHGGFLPNGFGIVLISFQSVIFAYSAIEMVGIAAGETKDPRSVMPKAVNGVVWRIVVFYIGSILLLGMLLPWTSYKAGESPFVTVFGSMGVPYIGHVMNLVVLTAALSSCNSGLYSTGRILKSLADSKEAPAFMGKMSSRHVPWGGIGFTAAFYGLGVVMIYLTDAITTFEIVTAVASIGVVVTWITFLYCQTQLRKRALAGELERPSYRIPGAPWTNWISIIFLAGTVFVMPFSGPDNEMAFYGLPVVIVLLIIGWQVIKRRKAAATV
ncbi:amino acid permease [Pseudonocardiaceae bacterium YIM PH 21723]|nr:amino acid permease [Pseudonocardiaceae bacterium YIM PH 21723]